MPTLSYSSIQIFKSCPYQYKLKCIEKVSSKYGQTIESFMGVCVHEALKELYIRNLTYPELIEVYTSKWKKQWETEKEKIKIVQNDENYYFKEGKNCLSNYYNNFYLTQPRNNFKDVVEASFKIEVAEGIQITGRIDRIEIVEDGVYVIHEYKTGKSQNVNEENEQIGLYQAAVYMDAVPALRNFKKAREVLGICHHLRYNKIREVRFDRFELESLLNNINAIAMDIINRKDFEKKKSNLCMWCLYYEQCYTPERYLE